MQTYFNRFRIQCLNGFASFDFIVFLVCDLFAFIKLLRLFVEFLCDFFVEFINFLLISGRCLDFHICDFGCKFVEFVNHLLDIFRRNCLSFNGVPIKLDIK